MFLTIKGVSLGLGLRLGNSGSALGNVLHLDVTVPPDGSACAQNVQFLIETKEKSEIFR
jgi:hypothetical protein